ncbi:MAG TPA: TrbI F-type domain-containing protein [Thermodesulfobacteriota bacterium]|nr:TrbI F-type domain-containing protein [Thermodesulfobacteriota bacterium]
MLKSILSGFLGAVIGGAVVAGWLYFFSPELYILDIKGIIDSEREKIVKEMQDETISQEEAGKEINAFFDEFNSVLKEYRKKGQLIMVKDAVLSGGKDISDEFKGKLEE